MHQYSAPLKERSSASLGRNFGDSVFLPMCNKRMSATENIKMSQKVGKLRKPAGEKNYRMCNFVFLPSKTHISQSLLLNFRII